MQYDDMSQGDHQSGCSIEILRHIVYKLSDFLSHTNDSKKEFSCTNSRYSDASYENHYWWHGYSSTNCLVGQGNSMEVTTQPMIFIYIPKCMSRSIRELFDSVYAKNYEKLSFSYVSSYGYPKLIVIRDPFHRAVSMFFQIAWLDIHVAPCQETVQTNWFRLRHTDLKKSFDLFLDYIDDRFYDLHALPQHMYLEAKGLSISEVEYVIIQEESDSGMKKLSEILAVDVKQYKAGVGTALARHRKKNILWYITRIYKVFKEHGMGVIINPIYHKLHRMICTPIIPPLSPQAHITLRNYVDNDEKIRSKIKRIYHKDFILYEEARARAL